MFAPPPHREHLISLYAFNLEIAKIREMVSEPMLGEIRLQWWRDVIEELYSGTVRRHAIVQPLGEVIAAKRLTRRYFDDLIDARGLDLSEEPPATMAALIDYAARTSSNLVALALEALEVRDDTTGAVGHEIGIAWALAGLLRALPSHLRAKRVYLPRELIERHGVAMRDLMELRCSEALRAVVQAVAEQASAHLQTARQDNPVAPREAVPALLLSRLASAYLRRFRAVGYDPFDQRLARPMPFKGIKLAAAALARRV